VPLIEITASPATLRGSERAAVLRAVNAAVASALAAAPDVAWSIWRDVDAARYAIGSEDGPANAGPLPPVVHVYARRTEAELALIVEAIGSTLREQLLLDGAAVLVTTQPFRG